MPIGLFFYSARFFNYLVIIFDYFVQIHKKTATW